MEPRFMMNGDSSSLFVLSQEIHALENPQAEIGSITPGTTDISKAMPVEFITDEVLARTGSIINSAEGQMRSKEEIFTRMTGSPYEEGMPVGDLLTQALQKTMDTLRSDVHALTEMTDWRNRDDMLSNASARLLQLDTDLDDVVSAFGSELQNVPALLSKRDSISHELEYARSMTPDDVVLNPGINRVVQMRNVQAGRFASGTVIDLSRETIRVSTPDGKDVLLTAGVLQGDKKGGMSAAFVDENGAPITRKITYMRMDSARSAEFGGTLVLQTSTGDIRFNLEQRGPQILLNDAVMAKGFRIEPNGQKTAGVKQLDFIDPTPPIILPEQSPTESEDTIDFTAWSFPELPAMQTDIGQQTKSDADTALGTFLRSSNDVQNIEKQMSDLSTKRETVRAQITNLQVEFHTMKEASDLLRDKTAVYTQRKNELLTARNASNIALAAWKEERGNMAKKQEYVNANAHFQDVKEAYNRDRPVFVGEMEAAYPAGTKAHYYLPKIDQKLRDLTTQESSYTTQIDGLTNQKTIAVGKNMNDATSLNASVVWAAEYDDGMLVRGMPDLTRMQGELSQNGICTEATLDLPGIGGSVTIEGWQGVLRATPTMNGLADGSPSLINALSTNAHALSLDFSGADHLVTRVTFTPESTGPGPLSVFVYRGEEEVQTLSVLPGKQCLLEEEGGITGIVLEQSPERIPQIAQELRNYLNQPFFMNTVNARINENYINLSFYSPFIPGREAETALFFFDRYPDMILEEQTDVIQAMKNGPQGNTFYLHNLAVDGRMNKDQIEADAISPITTHALGMIGMDWNPSGNSVEMSRRLGSSGTFGGVMITDFMSDPAKYRSITFRTDGRSGSMPTELYWIDGDGRVCPLPKEYYAIQGRTIVLAPNTPQFIYGNVQQLPTYSYTGDVAFAERAKDLLPPDRMAVEYIFSYKKNGPSGEQGFYGPFMNTPASGDFKFGYGEFQGNIVNRGTHGGAFTVDIYTGMTGTATDEHVRTFQGTIGPQQTIGFKFFSNTVEKSYVTVVLTMPDGSKSISQIGIPKPHFPSEDSESPAVAASKAPPKDEATLLYNSLSKLYGPIYVEAGTLFTEDGSELMPIGTASTALVQLVQGTTYASADVDTGLSTTILALHNAPFDDVNVTGEITWNSGDITVFDWTENPYDGDIYTLLERQKKLIPFEYGHGTDYAARLQADATSMASRLSSELSVPVSGYASSWKRALFDGYDLNHPDETMKYMLQDALYGPPGAAVLSSFSTLLHVVDSIEEQAKQDVQARMDILTKNPATYSTGFSQAKAEYQGLVLLKAFLILGNGITPDNSFWAILEWVGGEGMQFLGKFMKPGMTYALEGLERVLPGSKAAGQAVGNFVKALDDFIQKFDMELTRGAAETMDANINQGLRLTGNARPLNLNEKLALQEVMADYPNGRTLSIDLTDPRWPSSEGWVKKSYRVNDIEIHYVYNTVTEFADDFKFKY